MTRDPNAKYEPRAVLALLATEVEIAAEIAAAAASEEEAVAVAAAAAAATAAASKAYDPRPLINVCDRHNLMVELSSELLRRRAACSLTHSLAHSLAHSLIHSLPQPPTYSLTHSLFRALTHPRTHSLARSRAHPPTYSLTRSLTRSLTHMIYRRMLGHLKLYLQHFNPTNAPQVSET